MSLASPALAGGFFTTSATWEAHKAIILQFKKTKRVKFAKKDKHWWWRPWGLRRFYLKTAQTSRSARLWSLLGRHVLWSSTRKGKAQLAPKGSEGLGISTCILLNSSLKLNWVWESSLHFLKVIQPFLPPSSSQGKFSKVVSETVLTLIVFSAIGKPAVSTWGRLWGTSDHTGCSLGTAGTDLLAAG